MIRSGIGTLGIERQDGVFNQRNAIRKAGKVNHIARIIARSLAIFLRVPTRKIETVYQSRFLYRHDRLSKCRILVRHLYSQQAVVVVVDMISRVRQDKLHVAVRLRSVGIDTCPPGLACTRLLCPMYKNGITHNRYTPSFYINTRVLFRKLRTREKHRLNRERSIVIRNMPHFLTRPLVLTGFAHTYVLACAYFQKITSRLKTNI